MKLFYRQSGAGRNIIILHGLFGSSDNWNNFAKNLSEEFKVFTVDQRNHGQSFHDDEFNYAVMTRDLENFYSSQQIEKAILIGHSMGGKTAMNFTLNNPDKVDKLIVVDIAPRAYDIHHDHIIDALCDLEIDKMKRRKEVENALAEHIENKNVRLFLLKNLGRDNQGNLEWKINLPVIKNNLENIVKEITSDHPAAVLTKFIAGEKSNYVIPDDEKDIKRLFPESEIIYLKDVGHWLHAEAPEEFYEEVMNFIRK